MKSQMSRIGRDLILTACLLVMCLLPAGAYTLQTAAAASNSSYYVPNEYIIQAVAGSTLQAVQQSMSSLGASVVDVLPLPDTYVVKTGAVTTGSHGGSVNQYHAAVLGYTSPWVVKTWCPNYIYKPTAIPDDEFWSKQWNMPQIHMPQAWNVQKGSASVIVAVIDSGVGNHPELLDRLVPGYDYINNDADASDDVIGHGTHVAGIIAAQGDNQMGVCGVCWDGVRIMPLKFLDYSENSGSTSNEIKALNFALQNGANVVNMSYGTDNPLVDNVVEHAELQVLADAGIILCAAAGNGAQSLEYPPYVSPPAKYDECIAVGAVGPQDEIAPYSSYGPEDEVDIAAPGGDPTFGDDALVYSTMIFGGDTSTPTFGYEAECGTSMACPHVVGAAALLLSQGVSASEVRSRLVSTARKPVSGTFDVRKFGAGILDVSAALANGSLSLAKPVKGSVVTQCPDFKVNLRGIDPTSIYIYVDYTGDHCPGASDVPVLATVAAAHYLDSTRQTLSFNWTDVSKTPLEPGKHTLYVSGLTSFGGETKSDWGTFTVASRIIHAGQHLVSFPYQFANTNPDGTVAISELPSDVLLDASTGEALDFRLSTTDRARLIRWNAAQSYYASYITGLVPPYDNTPSFDDKAWVNPLTNMLLSDGTVRAVPTAGGYLTDNNSSLQFPTGTGYWLILQKDAVVNSSLTVYTAPQGIKIPLYKGWNLIGNPFGREVPLSSVHLSYQGQSQRTLDEDQLSSSHWVDANFYGYTSGSGYEIVPSDKRMFEPYEGYWVKANVGGISPYESLYMILQ